MPRRALLLALAALAWVGSDAATAHAGANACAPYSARPCLFPFPDDRFTVRDARTPTRRRVHLPRAAMPVNLQGRRIGTREYDRADGFSPGSAIIVRVPGVDTSAAVRANGLVGLRHLSAAYASRQRVLLLDEATGRRQLIWAELDAQAAAPADASLLIHPGKNLAEGHRFVVVLRGLRAAGGRSLGRAAWYARARRAGRARYATIDRALRRARVTPGSVYAAWDFTVASEHDRSARLLHIRDDAFRRLGDPNLADGKVQGRSPAVTVDEVIPEPGGDTRILREVKGTLTVPCYLDQRGCPPGARFHYPNASPDALPTPLPHNVQKTPFVCIVPTAAETRPARISLYGHGLLGQPTEVEARNVRDMAAEHDFVFCATPWSGMAAEDVPNAVDILRNLDLFPSLADRLQQGILNATYLGRAMLHPHGLAALPAFSGLLDRSALFYDGNSQGGIQGGALTAVAPDFRRSVLGVTGMDYGGLLLQRSVDFDTYLGVLRPQYPDTSVRPLLFDLIQQLWDRGEADGYALHMTSHPLPDTPAHTVLMQVGFGDHQVTNWAADVEARTIGAAAHRPVLDAGRSPQRAAIFGVPTIRRYPYAGSAIVYWDNGPALTPPPPLTNLPNRGGRDPHEDVRSTPAARAQKSAFLRTRGALVDPCGAKPCHTFAFTP